MNGVVSVSEGGHIQREKERASVSVYYMYVGHTHL